MAKRLEQRADEIAALVDVEITRQDSRAVIGWIEQVYGKPQQTVVTEDGSKPAEDLTLAELEKLRQRILEGDTNVTSLRKTA